MRKCTKCRLEFPATLEFFNGSKKLLTGTCKKCHNKRMVASRFRLKIEVLSHYSKGTPRCECCGETHIEFLTIDHIGGGGGKHRAREPLARFIFQWLKKHGFPTGFRVLCMNCNFSLGHIGYCPHKKMG